MLFDLYERLFNFIRKTLKLSHQETGILLLIGLCGLLSLFIFMNLLMSFRCGYINIIILFALSLLFMGSHRIIKNVLS